MAGAVISLVDLSQAPEDIQRAAQAHLDKGYRMTNEKRTLLHNAVAFEALEGMSYAVSAEMKKFTTTTKDLGLDSLEESQFTPEEKLLVEYARAIVRDHKHIPDDLLRRLLNQFGEEGLVVISTMAMFMIGNNYFNDILRVQSEFRTDAEQKEPKI